MAITWIESVTARRKRIGIEPPCTGSPDCAGVIHIEFIDYDGDGPWLEIHLTRAEIKQVRKLLKAGLDAKP